MSTIQVHQFPASHICGKCGRRYKIPQIRFCPHPKTNRESGAYICHHCCQRCALSAKDPFGGALNCDVFKISQCMQGVFWVIDGKLICSKEPPGIPAKRHEPEWEKLSAEITQGKKYTYYPRGRVDLRDNKAVIYLQPAIHTDPIEKMVVKEFNLENVVYQIIATEAISLSRKIDVEADQ